MKKELKLLVILLLLFTGCGKDPWEDYQPPAASKPQEEEPLKEEPVEEEPVEEEPNEEGPGEEEPVVKEPGTGTYNFTVKVMSLGIYNKNADYEAVAALVKKHNPDLVVLREVDSYNTRSGVEVDNGEEIAKRTGMNYFFAKGFDYRGGAYGAGVLSRFPIKESKAFVLPVLSEADGGMGGEERPMGMITVELENGQELVFVGTHTDDGSNGNRRAINRPIQASHILNHIEGVESPMVVAGNFRFQSMAGDEMFDILHKELTSGCTDCAPNYPADAPDFVADHIMFKAGKDAEVKVLGYEVGSEALNNRVPVIAEIQFVKE